MSKVVKIIATNENDRHFEPDIITDEWHAVISYGGPRTVCGIQLEGDDGYAPSQPREGFVTCKICLGIIKEIQAINFEQIRPAAPA